MAKKEVKYFEEKYLKWKDAVHAGVEKVIDSIEKDSRRMLNQRKTKGEEQTFTDIDKSWYHVDESKSKHVFGFEHSVAETVEFGGITVDPKSGDLIEFSSRPFFKNTIQQYVGTKSAQIIVDEVERSGLNEKI